MVWVICFSMLLRSHKRRIEVNVDLTQAFLADYLNRLISYTNGKLKVLEFEDGREQARQPIGSCDTKLDPEDSDSLCQLLDYRSTRVVFAVDDDVSEAELTKIAYATEILHNYYQVVVRIY